MANKINPDPARPLIVQIPVQPQRLQMPPKLLAQQRRALPAARVARLLAAQQDQRLVRRGPRRQLLDGGRGALGEGRLEGRGDGERCEG
jgi:hypothetical protein